MLCIFAVTETDIVTDVFELDIPFMLCKDSVKRALYFENGIVFIPDQKKMNFIYITSEHYNIPMSLWLLPKGRIVNHLYFVKEIAT